MTKPHYNWPRFWVPIDKALPFDSSGFLCDPEDEYAYYYYTDYQLKLLKQLSELPVAILLGEPGIGKSTALEEESNRLKDNNEACLYKELNQYHSDTRLIDDIFGSKEINQWLQGHYRLMLLLDSLDESTLTIRNVVRILTSQLKKLPRERLCLRLTCRTAEWPTSFTEELHNLWSIKDNTFDPVGVFELAPLRKKDIMSAAIDLGLDSNIFLEEILLKEIQPLASHPNTLNMLLSLFGRPDGLPKHRSELYKLGCDTLAGELSKYRKETGYTGKFSAHQRMAVAGRIAALMIFGQRSTIWLGDAWEADPADLLESQVVGDVEDADGYDFSIDSRAFQETVVSALFSGRGENRIGFAHQSYVEFLAAWYLHSCKLDMQRSMSLLLHPDDKRVPPQYAETAIWLAALDGNVFTALVDKEPLLLLRADLSDTTDAQKCYLTEILLKAFAARAEFDRDWGLRQHYRKLAHPNLATQLFPYIIDQEACLTVRNVAIEIAVSCGVTELAADIISVALCQDEQHYVRESAASAASDLANDVQLERLRPIALGECCDDQKDQLKAAVIPSLWPAHISTKEIFGLLNGSGDIRCLGNFRYRLEDFVGKFAVDDLIVALQWVACVNKCPNDFDVDRLKDAIMAKAWDGLDNDDVLNVFSDTVWACIDRYENIFNRHGRPNESWIEQDDAKRRKAILALLEAHSVSDRKRDPIGLIVGRDHFILPKDAIWLLECYRSSASPSLRAKIAKCIGFFVRWDSDPQWIDEVISVAYEESSEQESPLAAEIARLLEPIWLGSEMAKSLKEQYDRQKQWQDEKPKPLDPPPRARVEEALREFEAGKKHAWMRLWQELLLPDGATHYSLDFKNIVKSPGWEQAKPGDREKIIRSAEAWVLSERLSRDEIFLPDGKITYRHMATYLALRLILDKNPEILVTFPQNIWNDTALAVIVYPFDDDAEQRNALVAMAYEKEPEVVLDAYRHLIDRDLSTPHSPYKLRELAAIWDADVADMVRSFLGNSSLAPVQMGAFFAEMLAHGDAEAFKLACRMATATDNLPNALVAAQALLLYQARQAWSLIWEITSNKSSFGEELMLGVANNSRWENNDVLSSLSESEIAQLYVWLEEHFPATKDANYPSGEAHSVTARDQVGRMRDNCPNYLSNLGTQDAIDAMSSICERFPDKDWLKYLLNESRRSFRKKTLQSISPAELILYTRHREARLARTSRELMDAVVHSLRRLQEKLQGATPMAPFLWDLSANGKSGRPKSEDRLSDFIKDHLENDLPTFVIDREVQIRNLREHGIGERTDLKIETKDQDGRSISVIIENKGCWNSELMTAMQDQLYNRYLKLAREAYGIYLVGWYRCERWKDSKDCIFDGTKEELLTELKAQAKSISNDSRLMVFVLDATY